MEDNFDKLMEMAKEKIGHETAKTSIIHPSKDHLDSTLSLLDAHKDQDIIVDVDLKHNQYLICKSEKYVCVTSENLAYHYMLNDQLTGFDEMELG